MPLLALPIDVLQEILLALETRKCLAAFISSHRRLNRVFKAHPNSVLRQVVCNEIGMDIHVLPYAWGYLKCLSDRHSQLESIPFIVEVEPGLETSLTVSLKQSTFLELVKGHKCMNNLAKEYSIR